MKVADPAIFKIKKETILQYARHLFASRGYTESSMDDIARACDLQKASLYYYFKSKQQILEEMIELEGERWNAQLEQSLEGMDFEQSLMAIGTMFFKNLDDHARREFFQIIHFESHKNPEIFKAFKNGPVCKRGLIYQVFTQHLASRLSPVQIAMAITQFMGGIIHYATMAKLRGENMCLEPFSDSEYLQQSVRIYLRGLERV
jgi:AcrR family transcriptional regulator